LNRELGFMSARDQDEIGIQFGDYSMNRQQAHMVLTALRKRFPVASVCKDL